MDELDIEFDALSREFGPEAVRAARRVLAHAVSWLRTDGYGEIRLPALAHRFGLKLRKKGVVTVGESDK